METELQAATDAAQKGYSSEEWIFCANKAALVAIDIEDYDAIYMRTGVSELELEFAALMRRNSPYGDVCFIAASF